MKTAPGILVLLFTAAVAYAQTDVKICYTPEETYQTMTGWAATPFAGGSEYWFQGYKDTLFQLAIDDLGITRLRLEVRAGAENSRDYYQEYKDGTIPYQTWRENRYATVNDNDNPYSIDWNGFNFTELDHDIEHLVLPFKQRVEARGEPFHLNVCYVAFTGQIAGGEYHHSEAAEYAEFVLAAHIHMQQKYGLIPDTWEIILEPDNSHEWTGKQIGNAIVHAANRLDANGWIPRFVAPSTTSMSNANSYFDQL
ncbi:MAG: hypothetical protein CL946_04170, partial [Ectothiorhodospiraceae bacterium]|nr:hypothetical protein [Ectothiorhodospiraceae bacterium]